MAAAPQQQTTYSYSQQTSYTVEEIEEETNIQTVSYAGGKCCYTIGGFVGQKFSRMEKPTKRKWSSDAPSWRVATGGLNLEGE
jgi:hypothetical protein